MFPPNSIFPPQRRLHFPWEYKKFFGPNQKKRFGPFVVYRILNEFGYSRLGITVRGAPSSVVRNRLKRWTREAYRRNKDALGSYDINVVISFKGSIDLQQMRKLHEIIEKEFTRRNLPS